MRFTMTRLITSALIAAPLVVAVPAVAQGPAPAAAAKPNIVLIYTDDQRADEIWVMSRLQKLLVDQGTTFARAYSAYPLCCPARASILTGQYAHNHGVLGNASTDHPLGGWEAFDETSTVATWLDDAGYQTAYVGKYLNKYATSRPVASPPGWDDWNAITVGGDFFSTKMLQNGVKRQYDGIYQTDLLTDITVDIISERVPQAEPLFLVTSFYGPHSGTPVESDDPINTLGIQMQTTVPAPRHRDAFADLELPRDDPSFNEADVSDKASEVRDRKLLSPQLQEAMTEAYQQRLESLLSVDEGIGRIVDALAASGELANTIIAFTSDNGFMQGEHRIHAGKAFPYEAGISVPIVVRGPGFPVGGIRDQPVSLVDLAPTFAGLAGATPTLVVDGKSLVPLARDPQTWADRPILMMVGPRSLTGPNHWTAVRAKQWMYIEYHETDEVELYDMVADPYQLNNLAGNPSYSTVQARARAMLDRLRDCSGAECRRFN